ncbi:MAG: glucosaminidase domain-containing protein [Bacteroidales bacterium]|nr:glucosaminidase domain-containing protein [Bacteroidales bacterium]
MRHIAITILILFCGFSASAQMTPEQYIGKYAEMAVKEMKRSGVPASITLSQGMLESGNGNSYLAKDGNNHFGIKCHKWEGEKIYADDDAKGECFRKYKSVEESFKDHSDFLRQNSRYHFLFDLEITDYKGWAKGLKQAGYATSPTYAESLIKLIEKYELNDYDSGKAKPIDNDKPDKRPRKNTDPVNDQFVINPYADEVYINNNVPYVVVKDSIMLRDLSLQLDLMNWQLAQYNDLDKDAAVYPGEHIYIKPKRNKAEKQFSTHTLSEGESLRDVSQKYAVKIKKIMKYNNFEENQDVKPGTVIKLRK